MTKKSLPPVHGIKMYRRAGCRCEVCKAEARNQRKTYRPLTDSKKIRLDPQPLIDKLTDTGRISEVRASFVQSWVDKGIDIYWADFWCIKFGYHPAEIFGYAFYQDCFDGEAA